MADTTKDQAGDDVSVRQLRATLADVLHTVAINGRTVYITNHGRRIAAIVPITANRPERPDNP